MNEIQAIAAAYGDAQLRGELCALATIVRVQGSSYRKPGARMLILGDGRIIGSVSGGCLESDVVERAQGGMRAGRPILATYDTTGDDDIFFGMGMGCRGIVDVLIEPLLGSAAKALSVIAGSQIQGDRVAMATVYRASDNCVFAAGDHIILDEENGMLSRCERDSDMSGRVLAALEGALSARQSSFEHIDADEGSIDVFLEVLEPPVPLVIFGAGNDAQPLARMAKAAGWRVTVVDGRPAYATADRFREADEVILSGIEDLTRNVKIEDRTAVVVMTHNYLRDAALLETLLAGPARYIGILGSRLRTETLLQDLASRGLYDPILHAERVYGPVGLDIGANTPEMIAVAIIAEIQTAFTGRTGGRLRDYKSKADNSPQAVLEKRDSVRTPFNCALSA